MEAATIAKENEGEPGEADLIARVSGGDRQAFRELVRIHEARVFAFAIRLTANEADAMEVTQDTFLEAWLRIGRFRGESALSTWLFGIVAGQTKQKWRGRRRRQLREGAYARDRFDEAALKRAMPEARIDLERALQELPLRMRTALILHAIEGLPQKKVARVMGIAEGTVKAHVHHARKLLKEKLER